LNDWREGDKERKLYKCVKFIIIMNKRRPHNFYIEDEIWEEFKIYCIRRKKSATEVIANFIRNKVKK